MEIGRPTKYTQEIADYICQQLIAGRSLRNICENDEDVGVPHAATVFRWLGERADFCDQYRRAREAQADAMFDDLVSIADDGTNDWMEKELKSGAVIEVPNHEHISRSKLRVDTRFWILARLQPKKYGNKTFGELTGKDGAPVGAMSDAQMAAALNAIANNLPLPGADAPVETTQVDDGLSDLV